MDIAGFYDVRSNSNALAPAASALSRHPNKRAKSLKFRSLPVGSGNVNALPLHIRIPLMQISPIKPTISVTVFQQLDIRIGTIRSLADVSGSDKLMQLRVDFGDHQRTIVAGIKRERADLNEIVGKQALFVVNLEPRKLRGVISEGMLFDIGYEDGITPVLGIPEKPVPNGTRAG
jgi:tRNA-binding protein